MKCEGELINMTRAWDKEKKKNDLVLHEFS